MALPLALTLNFLTWKLSACFPLDLVGLTCEFIKSTFGSGPLIRLVVSLLLVLVYDDRVIQFSRKGLYKRLRFVITWLWSWFRFCHSAKLSWSSWMNRRENGSYLFVPRSARMSKWPFLSWFRNLILSWYIWTGGIESRSGMKTCRSSRLRCIQNSSRYYCEGSDIDFVYWSINGRQETIYRFRTPVDVIRPHSK